jgi:hypothetical protein
LIRIIFDKGGSIANIFYVDGFSWIKSEMPRGLPILKLVLSKFLKLVYTTHETQSTLDLKDPNMDGVLDNYDLDVIITHLVAKRGEKKRDESDKAENK